MLKDLIKAGKGYRDGIPYGVIGRDCDECRTPIVSIKMATSQKGMQCTSESVCPACGLIHQGPFAILDRYEDDYRTNEFESHDDWLAQMKKEPCHLDSDIDEGLEYGASFSGNREGSSTDHEYGGWVATNWEEKTTNYSGANTNTNINTGGRSPSADRLLKAEGRLRNTPQSKRLTEREKRKIKYLIFLNELKQYLNESKVHVSDLNMIMEDVELIITSVMKLKDKGLSYFHSKAKNEEIITSIFMWRLNKSIGRKIISIRKILTKEGLFNPDKHGIIKPKLDEYDTLINDLDIKPIVRNTLRGKLGSSTFRKAKYDILNKGTHLKPPINHDWSKTNTFYVEFVYNDHSTYFGSFIDPLSPCIIYDLVLEELKIENPLEQPVITRNKLMEMINQTGLYGTLVEGR